MEQSETEWEGKGRGGEGRRGEGWGRETNARQEGKRQARRQQRIERKGRKYQAEDGRI
jgi:hypothetical protein